MKKLIQLTAVNFVLLFLLLIINVHGLLADVLRFFGFQETKLIFPSLILFILMFTILSALVNKYFIKTTTKNVAISVAITVTLFFIIIAFLFSNMNYMWL